jgi:subtilase family serine protease
MTAVVHEADARARLNFADWYLHGDHDEEMSPKSLSVQQWNFVSTYWIPQISE